MSNKNAYVLRKYVVHLDDDGEYHVLLSSGSAGKKFLDVLYWKVWKGWIISVQSHCILCFT